MKRILRYVLALARTVVESIRIEDDRVVVGVRPHRRHALRCPDCGRRCACYDAPSASPRLCVFSQVPFSEGTTTP